MSDRRKCLARSNTRERVPLQRSRPGGDVKTRSGISRVTWPRFALLARPFSCVSVIERAARAPRSINRAPASAERPGWSAYRVHLPEHELAEILIAAGVRAPRSRGARGCCPKRDSLTPLLDAQAPPGPKDELGVRRRVFGAAHDSVNPGERERVDLVTQGGAVSIPPGSTSLLLCVTRVRLSKAMRGRGANSPQGLVARPGAKAPRHV